MAARHAGDGRRFPARYRALAGFIVASGVFVAIFVALTLGAFHPRRRMTFSRHRQVPLRSPPDEHALSSTSPWGPSP